MRYISYLLGGQVHVGEARGDQIVPLVGLSEIGPDWGIQALADAERDEAATLSRAAVTVLPVVPHPSKIFCVGLNYLSHIDETGRELPSYPVLFPKYDSSLLGADEPLVLPPESSQIDYEGEVAVIIGRRGRRIAEEDALNHVLGYSIANDITMRDYQYKTHQWLQGKAWDRSSPIGPYLVTPDDFDSTTARITTRVNSDVVQDSDLSHLIFKPARLVSMISEFVELSVGDIILTGTPGGVGFRRDPQLFLHPGDTVSVTVEGLGELTTSIVAG